MVSGRHLSTSEAAEKVGVDQATIVDWVQRGKFPNVHLESGRAAHGAFKIPEADVVGLLVGKSESWDERVRQSKNGRRRENMTWRGPFATLTLEISISKMSECHSRADSGASGSRDLSVWLCRSSPEVDGQMLK